MKRTINPKPATVWYRNLLGVHLLLCATILAACSNDDEPKDKVSIIEATVSSEIEEICYTPALSDQKIWGEFLKVKFGNSAEWTRLELSEIAEFHYEDGHEYKLRIEQTELANPPADGSSMRYKLIKILSDVQMNTDFSFVERYSIGETNIIIRGELLTESERQTINNDVSTRLPERSRRFKFVFKKDSNLKGGFTIYTNDLKQQGTFERSEVTNGYCYTFNTGDTQFEYIYTLALTKYANYPRMAFFEVLTDKYKAEYPNIELALIEQVLVWKY